MRIGGLRREPQAARGDLRFMSRYFPGRDGWFWVVSSTRAGGRLVTSVKGPAAAPTGVASRLGRALERSATPVTPPQTPR